MRLFTVALAAVVPLAAPPLVAAYVNFEVSQVHPVGLTPSHARFVAINTPDARLEVFAVTPNGGLELERSIPVGLEPVSVAVRSDVEAWVVNQLSDTLSVVDLAAGLVVRTIATGDEPSDVVFAGGRAFVAVAGEDAVKAWDLANLAAPPSVVPLFSRKPRALAAAGGKVYVVPLHSGNLTTVVNANVVFGNDVGFDAARLAALGLSDLACDGAPPAYPPLPPGITRNPALVDPPDGIPKVGLIVRFNPQTGRFEDETGADWSHCLPFRLPDHDLFVIDAATLAVSTVDHLGTSLFEVSVNPGNGKIYVPHTEARNFVRFEHLLGVRGHVVDNRVAIVDPANGHAVALVDLNAHVDRGSDPATNLSERVASLSQPGMMVWNAAGTQAWMTAIGSRKVFRIDGACMAGNCIVGPDRASPVAVETGEGPSGVAWNEAAERLYVLNRFANTIAIVDTAARTKVGELGLHDPSPLTVKEGRRFLYDAILGSGHGDAACSSCHLSGDRDDLAWDLGDPEGAFAPYTAANDNVRFIVPVGGQPFGCDPAVCASHAGFDPQKGPMTTQTLRGMLEPLHWRGDRATMNDFNAAFVGLMGTADIGLIQGKPAGLPADSMERFRQFALGMRFPPNPYRRVDDTVANQLVLVRGSPVPGNPATGDTLFNTHASDAGQVCKACHTLPFGAAGGTLGGVAPAEPTPPSAAALINGDADQSPHSDLKVPHLRNLYEKVGPAHGASGAPLPLARSGFGFTHDGAIPDMATFLSFSVFTLSAQQVADIASFMLHFPTGTRPAVGRQVTLPPGAPPTGPAADEQLLTALLGLGDLASPGRHCELTAAVPLGGTLRAFRFSGGLWHGDLAAEPPRTTVALRQQANGPLTFLCATLASGARLGGDRDEDGVLDGDDCAEADPGAFAPVPEIAPVTVEGGAPTRLAWDDVAPQVGPGVRYAVLGGDLATLRTTGLASTGCLEGGLTATAWDDPLPDPAPGAGRYWIVRAENGCGRGTAGSGREALAALACGAP